MFRGGADQPGIYPAPGRPLTGRIAWSFEAMNYDADKVLANMDGAFVWPTTPAIVNGRSRPFHFASITSSCESFRLIRSLVAFVAVASAVAAFAVPPPNPIISEGVPAYCSDSSGTAANANSSDYDLTWRSSNTPTVSQPAWLAYDLSSKAPKQVVVTWCNDSSYEFDYALYPGNSTYNLLQDYTIDVNTAPGGSVPTTGWVTLVTVTGNVYHSRSAVIDMTGCNWVRINCTAIAGSSENYNASCHMDVYDAGSGTDDTWLFIGDSITAGGMNLTGTVFAQAVNAGDSAYYPCQENGGMASWKTGDIETYLNQFLAVSPAHFVTLSLGTNDINTYPGDMASIDSAYTNLAAMANTVIAAGRVPIIPHVPWANIPAIQVNAPVLNAKIDALCASSPAILLGPDLFGYYNDNRNLIGSDNLHPSNPAGFQAYRSYWAKWALWSIYHPVSLVQPVSQTVNSGQDVTLSFGVSGEPSPESTTYQWYLNGTAIPSATSSTLVITGATPASAGGYTCTAMNATGVKTSITTTLTVNAPPQFINGAFIKGANLPWLDGNYNTWIGIDPTEVSWGCGYNSAHVKEYFTDMRRMGITVVRVWINQGDEGDTIDSNDYVTGVTPLFWANMDDCVQQAAATGVELYVTLNNGRSDWLENPDQAAAYMNNALIPMIQRYKGNNAIFAIDLMNEIDGAIAGDTGNWTTTGATWAQAQAYIQTFAVAVHNADPGRLVSCSSGWHAWNNLQNFKGLGLDFYDFHQYDDTGYIPPASSLNMDKPIYVGECGQSTAQWDDSIQNTAERNFLTNAQDGGYAGIGIWAYSYPAGNDYHQLINSAGSWRPVCYTIQAWGANSPTLAIQASSPAVAIGGSVSYTAAAAGSSILAYEWQVSVDGGDTWTNLTDTGGYSGSSTATFTVAGATAAINGNQYRCVETSTNANSLTHPATLLVENPLTVFTLAGAAGVVGSADGSGSAARFAGPSDLAVDSSGTIFVADAGNDILRKVTPWGVTSILAGRPGVSGSADGSGNATFHHPAGVTVDAVGNVYVADTDNDEIRKVSAGGAVSTLAGVAGASGSADGVGTSARFDGPSGIVADSSGNLFVADTLNHSIREITPAGAVTTIAGSAGAAGWVDATGSAARFFGPQGVAMDASGNLYVADTNNHAIRRIHLASGVVSTVAGGLGGAGSVDGGTSQAQFDFPSGVAVDAAGNIYVSDTDNQALREISTLGTVSTLAGLAGVSGSADGVGSAARFAFPTGVAVDGSGDVYVADTNNDMVRLCVYPAAPAITAQPQDQSVGVGANASFSVTATGLPQATYQWYFNGTAIVGANGSTYALADAQTSNAGNYTVNVTNPAGSVTSNPATLTLTAPTNTGSPSSGGGGGGAMEPEFLAALATLALLRWITRKNW